LRGSNLKYAIINSQNTIMKGRNTLIAKDRSVDTAAADAEDEDDDADAPLPES
jgi:hypothetical protein